jgi:hypothetical protein
MAGPSVIPLESRFAASYFFHANEAPRPGAQGPCMDEREGLRSGRRAPSSLSHSLRRSTPAPSAQPVRSSGSAGCIAVQIERARLEDLRFESCSRSPKATQWPRGSLYTGLGQAIAARRDRPRAGAPATSPGYPSVSSEMCKLTPPSSGGRQCQRASPVTCRPIPECAKLALSLRSPRTASIARDRWQSGSCISTSPSIERTRRCCRGPRCRPRRGRLGAVLRGGNAPAVVDAMGHGPAAGGLSHRRSVISEPPTLSRRALRRARCSPRRRVAAPPLPSTRCRPCPRWSSHRRRLRACRP